jgi:predicted Zn-dependent peptidase
LDRNKRRVVTDFVQSLEGFLSPMRRAMELRQYGLPADYWDKYPAAIMKLTAEDVRRVARKYVPVDNAQIVVVGDASKIGDQLKKFGPVEEYSAAGQPVGTAR